MTLVVKDNIYMSVGVIETFSTGATLLDCIIGGGWPQGSIINIQGDSSSGKTLLILEAAANFLLKYPNGKIGFTEREPSFSMDYVTSLGIPVDKIDFWQEIYTFEDWFTRAEEFKEALPEGTPGLLLLDSLDSLSDDAEMARDITDGTFGGNKPKKISEATRRIAGEFEERGITTMIISQLRDVLNSPVPMKKASGGRAVEFYSGVIIRLNEAFPNGKVKRVVGGVERVVGLNVHAKCNKCKVGPPFREGNLRLIFGYGVDDIVTNLEFLKTIDGGLEQVRPIGDVGFATEEENDKPKKGKKPAKEGTKSTAIFTKKLMELTKEEINERANEIALLVKSIWTSIEASLAPKYKKY
jgi:RecA/RadA recombinase